MTPDEVVKVLEQLNCILADKQWVTEKQHESVESAISLIQELQRLKSREGNAKIELCYDDGKNPFARESLKIVDFGYSDNIYIVESSLIQDYQKLRVMGGVELNKEIDKIIVEAVNQNLEISEQDKNAGKCLYCPGATQKIIDLCNARLAGKMKGIEKICFDHISIGTSEYYKMLPVNLAGAIVTYLGG